MHQRTPGTTPGDQRWARTASASASCPATQGADFFVVLAGTDIGVSVFAVERDAPGVSTRETREAETFGLRNGPHVNLILDDVELPADALIGEEGKGLRQAMVTLSNSRTLAAGISLGIARAAFDESFAYVRDRSAFGGKIIDFQGIQWYFADAAAELDAARLIAYLAARDLDGGGEPRCAIGPATHWSIGEAPSSPRLPRSPA